MRVVDSFDAIRPIMSRFSMLAPLDKDGIRLQVRAACASQSSLASTVRCVKLACISSCHRAAQTLAPCKIGRSLQRVFCNMHCLWFNETTLVLAAETAGGRAPRGEHVRVRAAADLHPRG